MSGGARFVAALDAYLVAREDFLKAPTRESTIRLLAEREDLARAYDNPDDTEPLPIRVSSPECPMLDKEWGK